MKKRSTNLDVRAYAMEQGVRLGDIAEALGISRSEFSVQYMRMEQPESVKEMLKAVVDQIKGE